MSRTELGQLGEFGLIDRLTQQLSFTHPHTTFGIGDDAAVLQNGSDKQTLVSTDMLVEGIHFDLSYVPLQHLGYKAVAVNVSDIAAMNGTPKHITISLALSNRFSVEAVEALYAGISAACQAYNVDLVGGDTTSSRSGLVISVTVLGEAPADKISYRKGAKPNDILCVTGDLGAAYLGLQIFEREKRVFLEDPEMQPQLEGKEYILGRQLRPEARTNIIYEMADLGLVPTAMIDISDGLASELLHLCRHSQLGAVLFADKIPLHQQTLEVAESLNLPALTAALYGGEDYELLFTVAQADFAKIEKHDFITPIGYMTDQHSQAILRSDEGDIDLQAQGWNHFGS
ncbi:thiamine-phosphate kinase [Eisenibacter elegans]|uniref:thiamine-phosphate kinase n=1 Tax=Eisenibacter elegans TaxID=997 RepID=UPI00040A05B8|nr:thiamine-phosphate kinase [Eisenibacter elegans]